MLTCSHFKTILRAYCRQYAFKFVDTGDEMSTNPKHFGSFTFKDTAKQTSNVSFNFGAITALTIAAFLTQFGTFRTATQALSIGALVTDSWTGDKTKYSAATPTDDNARRERKWRVDYEDVVNFTPGQIEIPVAKVTGAGGSLVINDTEIADLTQDEWVDWIAAFEALCKSDDGNGVNVLGAVLVGRNL